MGWSRNVTRLEHPRDQSGTWKDTSCSYTTSKVSSTVNSNFQSQHAAVEHNDKIGRKEFSQFLQHAIHTFVTWSKKIYKFACNFYAKSIFLILIFSVHLKSNVTKSPLVIFGIPTVARQSEFYLLQTLTSLKKYLKKSEESQCQFVIQISEVNESKALRMIDTLNKTFHMDIQEGLIEVILIDTLYYPTISTVSKTQESTERVYWRTKQNLDLIYLMWFCSQRKNSTFYVQLEDDIITRVSKRGKKKLRNILTKENQYSFFIC